MKEYRFYKTQQNDWYIDLPEWKGDQAELLMVEGADIMLDILSEGNNTINLVLDTEPYQGSDVLIKEYEDREGAYYKVGQICGIEYNMLIWLCEVTHFVFNSLPEKIYMSKI